MERTYSHIDLDERRKIARWRMAGLSVGIIAEKLGRHRSTIFREVRRNMFVDKQIPDLSGYYCVTAHEMGTFHFQAHPAPDRWRLCQR